MVYEIIDKKTGIEVARVYIRGNKVSIKKMYGFNDVLGQNVDEIIRINEDFEKIKALINKRRDER